MLKKIQVIFFLAISFLLLSGCGNVEQGKIQRVGLLVENSIQEETWAKRGYEGLLNIGDTYNVDVYYKEGIKTEQETIRAVDEFVRNGVNLIYGHSSIYGKYFIDIANAYPDVHFVYFNGGYRANNVTSLNFNAHAMGFFGGMVAGEMTKTNQVGIIAAYEWQPEIEGFYEGVKYQNQEASVYMNVVNDWDDKDIALDMYEKMRSKNADVIYPTGDSFSSKVIQQAGRDQIYAIGYVRDQSDIDKSAVLTSTMQDVGRLYEWTAEQFNKGKLKGEVITFDFQDEAISLGKFNPDIPEDFQKMIQEDIDNYIETGLLPNEMR